MFLIGIIPIWDLDIEEISYVIEYVNILWKDSYQSVLVQILSAIMFVVLLIFRKKSNPFLWWLTLLLSIGFITFIFLWFKVFDHHDYYLINQLIFMISIFLTFFYLIKKNYRKLYQNIIFRLSLALVLIYNINQCSKNINHRYHGWPNEKHLKHTKALEDITPYLRSLEISQEDTVAFMHDPSLNISLYLMGQKGYTNFASNLKDSNDIAQRIKMGVKYIIINDSSLFEENYLKPFLYNQIGQHQNIHIFKVR